MTQLLNFKKKNVYILCLFTKQINNFLSNNTTMPSVHYLLKIKIKENVSNRDYIHIYIQIYRNYAINYFYYVRKIRLISHHRAFTNNVTFPLAAQIFSSPLFTRARLPTSFLNRLICIPGTCVSRHNMQMSRPSPRVSPSIGHLPLQSIHLRKDVYLLCPPGASFLLITAIYYNFRSPFSFH